MPFASIIGHGPAVAILRQAVARGRVPQSLIFAGPDGVGKRAVAVALAQAVNCPSRQDGDPCGRCRTCLRIARGQHSDVAIIEPGDEASIKIKHLRERVLESVNYRPFEAEHRVFIIDPADIMTAEAQDALLKTLEEPPAAAIIVLVTAYADTLHATIRSRCRRLTFGPLVEADVAQVLVERAGIETTVASRLAAAAGGSVSRALSGISGDVEEDRDRALALLNAASAPAVAPRLKASADLVRHGSDRRDRDAVADRLAVVQALLRDLAALAAPGPVPLVNADLADALGTLRPAFDAARVAAAFAAAETALRALDRNASPKIVADWLAVTI